MTNSGAQRAELHKAIWNIANVLRGSVDGWDFKQYVLGFLFYRFISEDITSYLNGYEHQAGDVDFDYAKLDDATAEQVRKSMVEEKGYFILPSDLFANVRRCADADENLNETLQRVFKNIEGSAIGSRSESSLRGLFDDLDLNSRKLGDTVVERNAKLVKVLNAIGNLDLGTESFADNTIDAFGDAYEYLMTMYAANAGKSGGEFFTPQEVSELLTRIATHGKSEVNKVYDPACGSGSLLLQSIKVLGKDKVRQGFFGQEKNLTTYNLCRINMFLHDVNYDHFNIERKERTVACNNREIRLPRKLFYRRFYTYHILHPVGFARDDVVASQVHIAHFGRKKDMHRLAESDLNFIRSDMLARRQNPDGICRSFFLCEAGG